MPRGCGLKGSGLGWTGPKRADLPRVDLVMSRGNWRQVDSGSQGAWGQGGGVTIKKVGWGGVGKCDMSQAMTTLSHPLPHQQSTMMAYTALGQPGGGGWQ